MKRVTYDYWLAFVHGMNFIFHPEKKKEFQQLMEKSRQVSNQPADVKFRTPLKLQQIEHETHAPELIPHETAIFMTACDMPIHLIKVHKYRKLIQKQYRSLYSKGVNTFIVDYGSPYGLLALEVLLQLKQDGESIFLYCYKRLGVPRKSYRLIKECTIEIVKLAAKCDYSYDLIRDAALFRLMARSKFFASEAGILSSDAIRQFKKGMVR